MSDSNTVINPTALRNCLPPYEQFLPVQDNAVQAYLAYYDMSLTNTQTIGVYECGSETLVAQAFFAPQAHANVVLVHGYMDHTALYGKIIRHLLAKQLNVYMVDLPGHGLSSGQQASINNFASYRQAINGLINIAKTNCADGPWHLMGQSMGGAISMSLLQHGDTRFAKAILFAPLVQPRHWRLLRYVHTTLRHVIDSVPRHFADNSHDDVFNEFLAHQDKLQTKQIPVAWVSAMRKWRDNFLKQQPNPTPMLVIQGTADSTIDWRFGHDQILRLFPQSHYVIVNDAMHHMVNEAPPYLDQIFTAVDSFLD